MALSDRRCWSVSALCRRVADVLDADVNPVQVQGEIVGFVQAGSGHCYFSLKDAESQLRCAMFRRAAQSLPSLPSNGQRVEVLARIGLHAPRGDLQLIVEDLRSAGQGSSMEEFLRLKAQLEREGLLAPECKRVPPKNPQCIGLVTSADAAALADVLTALERRAPQIPIVFVPTLVQGHGAEISLVQALESLYQRVGDLDRCAHGPLVPDVILLVRGGGAWEDLHAFNDERVARCIARSPLPIITGVGHETDFTIADFVADLRAATPTAAAELCAQPIGDLQRQIEDLRRRLTKVGTRWQEDQSQSLDWWAAKLARPQDVLVKLDAALNRWSFDLDTAARAATPSRQTYLDSLRQRLDAVVQGQMTRRSSELEIQKARLEGGNPERTLHRGFVWLQGSKGWISKVSDVFEGEKVRATLVDGVVELEVQSIRPESTLESNFFGG